MLTRPRVISAIFMRMTLCVHNLRITVELTCFTKCHLVKLLCLQHCGRILCVMLAATCIERDIYYRFSTRSFLLMVKLAAYTTFESTAAFSKPIISKSTITSINQIAIMRASTPQQQYERLLPLPAELPKAYIPGRSRFREDLSGAATEYLARAPPSGPQQGLRRPSVGDHVGRSRRDRTCTSQLRNLSKSLFSAMWRPGPAPIGIWKSDTQAVADQREELGVVPRRAISAEHDIRQPLQRRDSLFDRAKHTHLRHFPGGEADEYFFLGNMKQGKHPLHMSKPMQTLLISSSRAARCRKVAQRHNVLNVMKLGAVIREAKPAQRRFSLGEFSEPRYPVPLNLTGGSSCGWLSRVQVTLKPKAIVPEAKSAHRRFSLGEFSDTESLTNS